MRLIATGKSVEIAIQNGLLELGLKREDVEIKVLDAGGILKKAKVELIEKKDLVCEPIKAEEDAEPIAESSFETVEDNNNDVETSDEKAKLEPKKKRVVDTSRIEKVGSEFLLGLAKLIDENVTIEVTSADNEVNFALRGEKLGKLIGFHGENMQALQVLLTGLKTRGEGAVRLFLDIDGYKASRNQTIADLANKIADQAVKIERNIHMDPMNGYDRRIVHTTLQEREDVTTESTGEGEKRHVVVKPTFKR